MPPWNELVLSWDDLHALPRYWRTALAQWRGIYYIHDRSDNLGYVGSASGSDNILGGWMNYAASGDGGNRHLKGRDPKCFVFSMLQSVALDMDSTDLVKIENHWKKRLDTRYPHGMNDN